MLKQTGININQQIPKYRIEHILKLYEASKYTLGHELRIRRRGFISLIRLYYPWESYISLSLAFEKFIKPKEIEYMIIINSRKIKKENGAMVKALFGCIDTNGDNCIDLDEFKYALRDVKNIEAEKIFHEADTNGDSVLNEQEFYKLVASVPEIRDNFDKIISNTIYEIKRKDFERLARIFKVDITGRRPSLCDLRLPDDICINDIPLYGVSISPTKAKITKRHYGSYIK
tara:strand:+ start:1717 stop:2406 length:690 start_codon:yes stop_codon:yes gene_type:complete